MSQDDGSSVDSPSQPSLTAAATLMGIAPASLEQSLTVKSVGKVCGTPPRSKSGPWSPPGQSARTLATRAAAEVSHACDLSLSLVCSQFPVVQVPQTPLKATATRDALAKALYSHLFEWTITQLNSTMGAGAAGADAKVRVARACLSHSGR